MERFVNGDRRRMEKGDTTKRQSLLSIISQGDRTD